MSDNEQKADVNKIQQAKDKDEVVKEAAKENQENYQDESPKKQKENDTKSKHQEKEPPKEVEKFGDMIITNRLNKIKTSELIKQQSVPVKGMEGARRCPELNDGELLGYKYDDVRTTHELFLKGLKVSNNGPCLGWRPNSDAEYTWLSHQQVLEQAQWVGSGIINKGGKSCQSQMIGIYSPNRVEWSIVDKTCAGFSMISVPLYDTLGEQAMVFIVQQCEIDIIFIDINKKAEMLLKETKEGNITSLKLLVLMEEPSSSVQELAQECNVEICTYEQIKKIGQENVQEFVLPGKEDLYTICYTSGTTGNPKGVMLTHANMITNVASALYTTEKYHSYSDKDVLISYLPLAHILERELQLVVHMFGGRIGFFGGNIRKVMDDALVLKPTIFPLVPRLMNKIYDKVWAMVSQSTLKRMLLNLAVSRKQAALNKGHVYKNTIWDKLIFGKVQSMLGGNVEVCVTGAAPISANVLNFMRCALGISISEAYGATETTAGTSTTFAGDFEGGNVGGVLPGNIVKLVDVEDKNYFAKDGKGEICIKGPNVFKGYYKDEKKTKEALDEDGWYHSGDVGQWLPNGALKIIDRKKNIFKLSQGEYIAPEKIEQVCLIAAPVAQCFVHGNSLKSTLVGVVVPDEEVLAKWCSQKGFTEKLSFDELCKNEKVNALILADMTEVGKQKGLKSFELIKKVHLTSELFSVENDLMTPTLKNKRPQILEKYQEELNKLYETLE